MDANESTSWQALNIFAVSPFSLVHFLFRMKLRERMQGWTDACGKGPALVHTKGAGKVEPE